jgi:predicted membrane-bound mannosyltransferase
VKSRFNITKQMSGKGLLFSLGSVSFILSMVIVFFDHKFNFKWVAFYLWVLSVLSFILYFCNIPKIKASVQKEVIINKIKNNYLIILIFILAIISHLLLLNIYPYPSIGDELRDGGWDAMRIVKGEIDNIFFYGRYESHGLLIPTISSYFYRIFGSSPLTFRLPTAIISLVDVAVLYLLVRKFISKKVAIFAMLVFMTLPLHLYYARTEIVVVFSSLFTTLIIYLLYNFIQEKNLKNLSFLGITLGIALNLHASVRTVVFFTILLIFGYAIKKLIESKKVYTKYAFFRFNVFIYDTSWFWPEVAFHNSNNFFPFRNSRTLKQ